MSENNGLADLFDDLMNGRKTVDQVKMELEGATMYLRSGKNYRALKFNGFARINGTAVNCYVAGEKIDTQGVKVEPKSRPPKPVGAGKGKGK